MQQSYGDAMTALMTRSSKGLFAPILRKSLKLFYPHPEFNEESLPRSVRFYNLNTNSEQAPLPLVISNTSGLGVDFALMRWQMGGRASEVRASIYVPGQNLRLLAS